MIAKTLSNIGVDLFFILLPILLLLSEKRTMKRAFNQLGFNKITPLTLAKKTIVLFAVLMGTALLLVAILSIFGANDLQKLQEVVTEMRLFPVFLCLMVTRVTAEEVFFRGFLVQKIGLLGSTAIFALFHALYFSVAEVVGAFVLGLVLAKTFQLNKNLYPNILAHFAYNATAIILFY